MVFLVVLCAGLLLLPFYPAWHEWRTPSDASALGVSAQHTSDTTYLARQFRDKIALLLANGSGLGYEYLSELQGPVYTPNDFELDSGAVLSQVLSEGRISLGPRSRISGWVHSNQALVLGEASVAVRRISSAHSVYLARHCCFERVHAPVVYLGSAVSTPLPAPDFLATLRIPLHALPGAQVWGDKGWRIEGDCHIPEAHHFTGSLVVTGVLSLGANALVEGDVKARQGLCIGSGAGVTGAVVCENAVRVLSHAWVGGPLVSESHLLVEAGARLGSRAALTTISAARILAAPGVIVHGTVWARQTGVVWGAA